MDIKNFKKESRKLRYLWRIVAIILGIIVLLAVYQVNQRASIVARLYEENARQTSLTCEQHTRQVLDQVDLVLRAVRMSYTSNFDVNQTEQYIQDLNIGKSIIGDIFIVDAAGNFILPMQPDQNVLNRAYFIYHNETKADVPYITTVAQGVLTGENRFRVTRRINQPDGTFAGVIIAAVNPYSITRFYKEFIAGHDNTITLLGATDRKMRAFNGDITEEEGNLAFGPNNPTNSYQQISPIDHIKRTYVETPVEGYPLVVSVGFSDRDIDDELIKREGMLLQYGSLLSIFFIMLVIILWIIYRKRKELSAANDHLASLYEQMEQQALYDALTGLPTRVLFKDRLQLALQTADRDKTQCYVMFLDLDGFKGVNDQFGHDAGDLVLKVTGDRIAHALRSTDTVCRWGGDEFVLLIPRNEESTMAIIKERLCKIIAEPIEDGNNVYTVGASIGVAAYPIDGNDVASIIKNADEKMYVEKIMKGQ